MPEGHLVQAERPSIDAYVPASQEVQEEDPEELETEPAEHLVQDVI